MSLERLFDALAGLDSLARALNPECSPREVTLACRRHGDRQLP